MTDSDLAVSELIEYCQVQADLLSGSVETMSEEIDEMLAAVDGELDEMHEQLDGEEPVGPQSTTGPDEETVDVAALKAMEADIKETQRLAKAKQARMIAFHELAAGYTELATTLLSEVTESQAALERVVEFELEHDAAAYFPDRQTVAEAVAESNADSEG